MNIAERLDVLAHPVDLLANMNGPAHDLEARGRRLDDLENSRS